MKIKKQKIGDQQGSFSLYMDLSSGYVTSSPKLEVLVDGVVQSTVDMTSGLGNTNDHLVTIASVEDTTGLDLTTMMANNNRILI